MPSVQGILQLLSHPTELRSIVNYNIWHDNKRDITKPEEHDTSGWDRETMRECWGFLDQTSRSFAMVIKELDGDLARTVCLFYVILRACDTLEDDMTIPNSVKIPSLQNLHLKLYEPGWTFNESNEKDKIVLQKFDVIQKEFATLDPKYQNVIADTCRKMGAGMADFAAQSTPEKPVAEISTIADYDLYCHYVAGLVGEGLSGLFSSSGKERPWIAEQLTLSNSTGMLLQKTNILRDVREDVDEGRGFWPRAIWGKHGFGSMKDLVDPAREREAMFAASEMTLDALRHATDALDYMTLLKCQSVFNFVAIPAVMAIATLDICFMNPKILKGNVKLRRGQALQLIHKAVNPKDVGCVFLAHASSIHRKTLPDDPNLLKISIACGKIEQWVEHHYPTFLEISGSPGQPATTISTTSRDARASLYARLVREAQEKVAAEKREAMMADLRARGIIKTQTPEQKAAQEEAIRQRELEGDQAFPWLILLGIVAGILALMGLIGWGIVSFIMWYFP